MASSNQDRPLYSTATSTADKTGVLLPQNIDIAQNTRLPTVSIVIEIITIIDMSSNTRVYHRNNHRLPLYAMQ
jgi:hypothetical protein